MLETPAVIAAIILGYVIALSPKNNIGPVITSNEVTDNKTSKPDGLKIWTLRDSCGSRDVRIESGVVRGYLRKDNDAEYFSFLGIPYAAPPTGSSRFMPPLPPKPWLDTFDANRTIKCPQMGIGDEDCLVVNVFTPTAMRTQLPVLVYIHGGSFLMGSGPTQGLGLLVKQHFVVVTLNYRLGVLGFLCLGIEEALGNVGLKDQLAALLWIQKNIQQFGGDPSQVTLYGMSAGAASVEFHVLVGEKKGNYFHKAIIESGSATTVWAVDSDPIDTAKNFANMLKPDSAIRSLDELVNFLQRVPAKKLSEVNYQLYRTLTDGRFGFVPCIENQYNAHDAFILEPPLDILARKNYTKVPLMFLYSSLEGLYLRSAEYYELDYKLGMNEDFLAYMPADLYIDREPIKKPVLNKVKREYFGMKGIVDDDRLTEYLNFFGDSLILHGMFSSVEKYAEPNKPLYLMEFAYKSERGGFDPFYEYINLPGHGDIARNIISTIPISSRSDKLMVNRLARLISNFAKFGDPTPSRSPLLPINWPTVRPGNLSVLILNQEFSVNKYYKGARKQLWDELYTLYRKPVKAVNPFIYL